MSSTVVRTGIDAYVNSATAYKSTNYGSAKTLQLSPGAKYGYIWLKSPVPLGGVVLSATLQLFTSASAVGTFTVSAQLVSASWSESRIDYVNRPAGTGTVVASAAVTNPAANHEIDIDVSALYSSVAAGARNYGILLTVTGGNLSLWSLNATANKPPALSIMWDMPPEAPTELVPAGGASVPTGAPVLLFNYFDVAGSTTMQACQVQIDPAANWAAPAWDSGTVASSWPELDLSITSYPALASGASTYWRVRVQDSAGQWSPWSLAAEFTYTPGLSVAWVNPSGGTVGDTQPVLQWTVTGGTQAAFRVTIAKATDPTVLLLDTGRVTSTANDYTVPEGIITSQSIEYLVTLWTWDDVDRQTTPGKQTFTESVVMFNFAPSASADPISALAAASPSTGQPGAVLTWQRSAVPDDFVIWRDGVAVATVTGASAQVSGTDFTFTDWGAIPNKSHTFQIGARESGTSDLSAAITFTPAGSGMWIIEPTQGLLVALLQSANAQVTWNMPEQAGTYYGINGGPAVRISQGHAGLEGTVTARTTDYAGVTAESMLTSLEWLQDHPETEVVVLLGNVALPIARVGAFIIAPPPDASHATPYDRQVTFSFWDQAA